MAIFQKEQLKSIISIIRKKDKAAWNVLRIMCYSYAILQYNKFSSKFNLKIVTWPHKDRWSTDRKWRNLTPTSHEKISSKTRKSWRVSVVTYLEMILRINRTRNKKDSLILSLIWSITLIYRVRRAWGPLILWSKLISSRKWVFIFLSHEITFHHIRKEHEKPHTPKTRSKGSFVWSFHFREKSHVRFRPLFWPNSTVGTKHTMVYRSSQTRSRIWSRRPSQSPHPRR